MFRLVVLAVALSSVTWAAPTSSDLTTNYVTNDGQTRQESVSADGTIFGEYSYVDTNGKLVKVKYSAGKDGFKAIGDHLPVEPAVPAIAAPQSSPVQPQGWNNAGLQQQPALRTPQLNSWNNVPQQPAAPLAQPQSSQLNPASTWRSQPQPQPQPQWNSQPVQAWSQPQPQQQWNAPSQFQPQQQWNAPSQLQPQQQWNVQSQPQWQNQPVTNWQQPQPWSQNPVSRIGQQPQQSAKVNFSQQPGQGFSFSVNS